MRDKETLQSYDYATLVFVRANIRQSRGPLRRDLNSASTLDLFPWLHSRGTRSIIEITYKRGASIREQ